MARQRQLVKHLKLIVMILIAPILIICTALSVQNLIKTYAETERAEREVMWQIVQTIEEYCQMQKNFSLVAFDLITYLTTRSSRYRVV